VRGAHEEAFASLAKLHRAAGNWQALVDATVRQIDTTTDPHRKAGLHGEIGRLYEQRLADPRARARGLLAAESLGDDRPETYEALARLSQALEDWWSA
jgi:sirohydrochlorin ferrochelatase